MRITKDHLKKFIDLDTVFSAAITVFFLVIFITTLPMEEMTTYLLPRLLGTLGIIIGLAALIVKFYKISEKGEKGEVKDKKEKPKGINVLYTILFTLAYFFLMRPLGFILTTAIAILAFSFLMKSRKRVVVIIVAVLLPIALHLLFVSLLKVSLPQGIVESILRF